VSDQTTRGRTALRRTAEPCGSDTVAGAKLSVAKSIQPDWIRYQAGSDGDKTNSLTEDSAV
jgi:hypothetical protein